MALNWSTHPERQIPWLFRISDKGQRRQDFTVLQEEQRFSTFVPHFMQNSASAGLS
jgi:hypothetical protein